MKIKCVPAVMVGTQIGESMRVATRKCSICKEPIVLKDDSKEYFIEYRANNTVCTHTNCYIKHHTTKKRNPKTIDECNEFINNCLEFAKTVEKKKSIKDELYQFIFDMYGISFLPKYFYIKFDSIYKGTYKNLNRPVPPEDLLDMWKQKRNYLDKIAEQNRKKGTEIIGSNRVNYDLAILLSRYDAYLNWKEQQKIAVSEMNESKKRYIEKIEYTDVVRPTNTKQNNNTTIDINSMLDEI